MSLGVTLVVLLIMGLSGTIIQNNETIEKQKALINEQAEIIEKDL